MLRWTPGKPATLMHSGRKYRPGDVLPGRLEDYSPGVRSHITQESSNPGPPAPAPEAKPAPIDEPAPAVQAERPDLSGLHWRRVARLSDGLGYGADDRSKAARLAWLDTLPAADVAAALAALED